MVSYIVFHSKVSSAAGVVMCKLADVHKAKMGAAILLKKFRPYLPFSALAFNRTL